MRLASLWFFFLFCGFGNALSLGEMNSRDPKFVFIFGGQGLEWYSMGRQLIQNEVVFKRRHFCCK